MRINIRILSSAVRLSACLGLLMLVSGCCCGSGWLMNNSGMGYYQKGNYALARNEFQRAVIDNPRAPDYRHNLAMAMQKTGDTASAEQVLRHNLSVDPMHQPTYHALAQLLISQQRAPEAEQLLTEWRDTQPYVPESYVELAWLQREEGNRMAAEQTLRQALQVKPNHPTALAHLGQLYEESGQPAQAAALYQRSLVTRWNQPQVHSRLATISGTTSSAINMRRSAMLQNDVYEQPTMTSQAPLAIQPMTVSYNATSAATPTEVAIVDEATGPGRHLRRRDRLQRVTAYPLPDYGMANAAYGQPDVMASTASPMISSTTISPGFAQENVASGQPQFVQPIMASNPSATYQADPAHAIEATAGLPIVDPH